MIYIDNLFSALTRVAGLVSIFVFLLFPMGSVFAGETEKHAKASDEACPMPQASDSHPTGRITGAGAHFSWIIFNSLKQDLEKVSGRKITLYGKDSMLGQGCNAGIKNAKLNGPGKETFGFVCCPLKKEEVERRLHQFRELTQFDIELQ